MTRAALLLALLAGDPRLSDPIAPPVAAEIVAFAPAAGTLAPGDTATSTVTVRNTGPSAHDFWIGYSVQDPRGAWHDVPAERITLAAGESAARSLRWPVPTDPVAEAGSHRVVMAVWDGRPGGGATRLASVDRAGAFRVESAAAPIALGGTAWHAGDHPLGRGAVRAAHLVAGPPVRLRLAPLRCEGAELRSDERYREGRYTARLRTPLAPGSLSAFFLYEDVRGGNDEIDIEIPNDGSRRVLLNVWVRGEQTHEVELRLPFDPAADFHDYTIELLEGRVRFYAEGALLRELRGRLPTRPMRLIANLWWPRWMECSGAEGEMVVESVEVSSDR